MLEIDGSEGEGGGQIVRSSVALSVITGVPIRITNLRAKRAKPGLRKQHVTAVQAAATICRAHLEGAVVGSHCLSFEPGSVQGGRYHFDIGTAGSTTLVLQTILPGLLLCREPSSLVLEGGTHNPGAPPFDFLAKVYLPLLRRMGVSADVTLERAGFYPQGGGQLNIDIHTRPCWSGLQLLERGEIRSRTVRGILANLPTHIAQRECNWIAAKPGWESAVPCVEQWENVRGAGNIVLVEIESQHVTEVFSACGQRGVRAEQVAEKVWMEASNYLTSGVPVGPYLTDQLLLPCGLAASAGSPSVFRTQSFTLHATTHRDILRRFLPIQFAVQELADGTINISVQ